MTPVRRKVKETLSITRAAYPILKKSEVYVHVPASLWNINAIPCTDRHDACPANWQDAVLCVCAYFFHGMEVCGSAYVSTRTKPEVFCTVHVYHLEQKM